MRILTYEVVVSGRHSTTDFALTCKSAIRQITLNSCEDLRAPDFAAASELVAPGASCLLEPGATAPRARVKKIDVLSRGKDDAEAGACADLRLDFDSAVVQLHGAEGLRQADAAALGFGGVIKVEDLVVRVFGDSGPAVSDGDEDAVFFVAAGMYREPPAVRHDLAAVDDDVEDRLFEQVGVGFDEQRA